VGDFLAFAANFLAASPERLDKVVYRAEVFLGGALV
jgi:hypothetical protein